MPQPTERMLAYLRQTVAHALARTLAPMRGPVHLNAPFRDPLPPTADDSASSLEDAIGETFFRHLDASAPTAKTIVRWTPPRTAHGLIVAGPAAGESVIHYMTLCRELAGKLGWAVVADALSPVRMAARSEDSESGFPVVTAYEAILRNETLARELTPDFVLCLGGWPTSKGLRAWLERSGAEILLVASTAANRDALHGQTRQVAGSLEALELVGDKVPERGLAERWLAAERAARGALDRAMETEHGLFEGKAAWLLARHLPESTPMFVASSMPVRDVEYFWPATGRGIEVFFSRGANGIDGTLSTALGIAHSNRPTVLLTGDLALLHDANGFLLRPKLTGSLTIVLINNRGGGIFEHLPVAQFDPPFEEFFATPQEVDFGRLCAAHGVEHVVIRDWIHFVDTIQALPERGMRVLEVRTDRKRDAAIRKAWLSAAGAACG